MADTQEATVPGQRPLLLAVRPQTVAVVTVEHGDAGDLTLWLANIPDRVPPPRRQLAAVLMSLSRLLAEQAETLDSESSTPS